MSNEFSREIWERISFFLAKKGDIETLARLSFTCRKLYQTANPALYATITLSDEEEGCDVRRTLDMTVRLSKLVKTIYIDCFEMNLHGVDGIYCPECYEGYIDSVKSLFARQKFENVDTLIVEDYIGYPGGGVDSRRCELRLPTIIRNLTSVKHLTAGWNAIKEALLDLPALSSLDVIALHDNRPTTFFDIPDDDNQINLDMVLKQQRLARCAPLALEHFGCYDFNGINDFCIKHFADMGLESLRVHDGGEGLDESDLITMVNNVPTLTRLYGVTVSPSFFNETLNNLSKVTELDCFISINDLNQTQKSIASDLLGRARNLVYLSITIRYDDQGSDYYVQKRELLKKSKKQKLETRENGQENGQEGVETMKQDIQEESVQDEREVEEDKKEMEKEEDKSCCSNFVDTIISNPSAASSLQRLELINFDVKPQELIKLGQRAPLKYLAYSFSDWTDKEKQDVKNAFPFAAFEFPDLFDYCDEENH